MAKVKATDAAQKRASELGVDLNLVQTEDELVTRRHVEIAADQGNAFRGGESKSEGGQTPVTMNRMTGMGEYVHSDGGRFLVDQPYYVTADRAKELKDVTVRTPDGSTIPVFTDYSEEV